MVNKVHLFLSRTFQIELYFKISTVVINWGLETSFTTQKRDREQK